MRKVFFFIATIIVLFVGCYHAEQYEDNCLTPSRECTAEEMIEINTKNLITVKGIRVMLEEELKTLPVDSSRAREGRRLLQKAIKLERDLLQAKRGLYEHRMKREELDYLKARFEYIRSLKRQ